MSHTFDHDLVARLLRCDSIEAARAVLREQLRTAADHGAAIAEFLLQQPQAQLRAHGLLAARLAGRADLVLASLTNYDPGV